MRFCIQITQTLGQYISASNAFLIWNKVVLESLGLSPGVNFFVCPNFYFWARGRGSKWGTSKWVPEIIFANMVMLYIVGSVFWCRFQIWKNFSKLFNFWPGGGGQSAVMGMVIRGIVLYQRSTTWLKGAMRSTCLNCPCMLYSAFAFRTASR